jgi:hypothetical protein
MNKTRSLLLVSLLVCAGAATAWQSALSAVGWTDEKAAGIAESFFSNSGYFLPNNGAIDAEIKKRWIGRSPAERTQAIRDLALHAKRHVQNPAFEKLYNGWILQTYDAVNHGIKIDPNAPPAEESVNAAAGELARGLTEGLGKLPAEQLRMLLTSDIDGIKDSESDSDKKLVARYRRIEPLLKTNLPDFRKQYVSIKLIQMTGSESEVDAQAAVAAGNKADAERKRANQQRAWDEHNLKAELRRRLTAFVATAKAIDFAAATQSRAGRQIFVNEELERKPSNWKVLYRLGKDPTMAAVAVAEQWLREL